MQLDRDLRRHLFVESPASDTSLQPPFEVPEMKSIMVSGEELSNHLLLFLNELPQNLYLCLSETRGA